MSQILNVAQKARLGLFGIVHRISEGVLTLDSLKGVIARGVVASAQISERLSKEFPLPLPSFNLDLAKKRKDAAKESNKNFYLLRPEYKSPRNPIVLCHGLYGFDKLGFDNIPSLQIHYWQGVAEALRKLGAEVIVTKVASTGSIAFRARQLHEFLEKNFSGQKVNLIAHSMGGLDGRYLISHIKERSYTVTSLTTVSTPHRGSCFMDWCCDRLKVGQIISEEAIEDRQSRQALAERFRRILDVPAYSHLTTGYCRNKFNPSTPDCPTVAYYSYNAYLDNMSRLNILNFPWTVINEVEGKNDGLVSLESAKWGQLVETVQAHHFDLAARFRILTTIGNLLGYEDGRYNASPSLPLPRALLLSPESAFDNIEFYLRMSTFLHSRGF